MILDLIVVALVLLAGFIGYKRGLIDMVVALLSSLFALILSIIVYPVIYTILKLMPLYARIQIWASEKISNIDFGTGLQTQGKSIMTHLNWLPEFMSKTLVENNNQEVYKVLGAHTINEYVSLSITNIIIGLLAILITWFILNIILAGGFRMLGRIVAKIPVISNINQLGGFVTGCIKGLFLISIVGLIVPLVMTMPGLEAVSSYIEASYLTKWLYENNLILLAINRYFY